MIQQLSIWWRFSMTLLSHFARYESKQSELLCNGKGGAGPEKEPAPLSWRFCPLLCWLKALPRPLLLPEGECFGMLHGMIHMVWYMVWYRTYIKSCAYYIVLYHDELTEGPPPPLPPWGWISPPLASHIFNQPSCSHSHALSNNNKHFNAGLLLDLCMSIWETSCVWCGRENEMVSNYVL